MKVNRKYRNVNSSNSFVKNKGDILFYCIILLIPLAQIAIFYFGVNFQNILMSFEYYDKTTTTYYWDPSININKFAMDIKEPKFWTMIGDSFIVWGCTQFAGTVFALFFSYYIYKKRKLYKFFKFVLFLPSIIPGILMALIFRFFMDEAMKAFFQLPRGLLRYSQTYFWIITVYTVWISFGTQVLIYSGAMDQIPTEILEAGKLDGATSFREFVSIVVPYIAPSIATFLIAGVATIFTNQNNLFSFYGVDIPGDDKTIGYYLYSLISDTKDGITNYCYASFLGLMSTCIAIPLTFLVRKVVSYWGDR